MAIVENKGPVRARTAGLGRPVPAGDGAGASGKVSAKGLREDEIAERVMRDVRLRGKALSKRIDRLLKRYG